MARTGPTWPEAVTVAQKWALPALEGYGVSPRPTVLEKGGSGSPGCGVGRGSDPDSDRKHSP